jgi:putative transposase
MPNYRRARVPGASYFFTVTLANRAEHLLVERIDALRRAFAQTRHELPFRVDAVVVLPEHLHCIWTLPPGDADFSLRWQRIKARFTHACCAAGAVRTTAIARSSRVGRSSSAPISDPRIWQQRFWEHLLRDDRDFAHHVDYIHFNPVKHGHTGRAADWPHSSIHRYIRTGLLPPDWADDTEIDGGAGERLA